MFPELILIALEENQSVHMLDGVEIRVVQHCQVEAVRMMTQERLALTFSQMTEIPDRNGPTMYKVSVKLLGYLITSVSRTGPKEFHPSPVYLALALIINFHKN